MCSLAAAYERLAAIPNSETFEDAPLARYTRFGIGGPASIFFDAQEECALIDALRIAGELAVPTVLIGGGTNLIVSDCGFRGVVLRYTGSQIKVRDEVLRAGAGAVLQDVVDRSIAHGLKGLETMTGIPGYLGGAVYGNAGAYGHSLQEIVQSIRFFDGEQVRDFSNSECEFRYRSSIFKNHKNWIVLAAELKFSFHDSAALRKTAHEIRTIRDAKYPPSMKCAGSIFKNLLVSELPVHVVEQIPEKVIREGKVPSAWFLEQTDVKGLRRGDIQVAAYHANLIYNDGQGTAADLVAVISELKRRVRERFGLELEEEVQYVGFDS
ncbi:MAG TPA: UDP-N-acetylmuramate dehydrogenase [Bryobacteraceae bacterium]|jgi:UDP-N-acetylmuramate dehydrogenase|nr:UDP-N-acetylmuramate dehydrogenase [Bryobacteraceae bacterium]